MPTRRERQRQQAETAKANLQQTRILYGALLALAAAGLVVSTYLSYLYLTHTEAILCEKGSGCDIVRESQYASILGLPVAVIGMLGYVAIGAAVILPLGTGTKRLSLFFLALAGFTFAAYLTYRETFSIGAFCPYCVVSAALITAILALTLWQRPLAPGWSSGTLAAVSATIVGLVLVTAVALPPDLGSPEPATPSYAGSLARHLTDSGAIMYGAYRCSACASQKSLFGDAAKDLPYVECDPSGKGAQPSRCNAAGVQSYPTWQIGGATYTGVQPLETLARLSGFTP